MIDPNNKYTKMQMKFYESRADIMNATDHEHHNKNKDYWTILLSGPLINNDKYCTPKRDWSVEKALDVGCGTGRNVLNLYKLTRWSRVDGVDISKNNIKHAENRLKNYCYTEKEFENNLKFFQNNGIDLKELEDDTYAFIMSTIVLQHIAVHEIRYSLLKEVYRVLKPGGIISFQMGFGEGYGKAEYFENAYNAKGTNTLHDVIVRSPDQIKQDLESIGFKNFNYQIRPSFSDGHPEWIFFKATK